MASEERFKLIIVDDDRETRETLALALSQEGFEVAQAANGLRLISVLHVDRPDLIILDVNMSWIDGFELCRSLRGSDEFGRIPVVFVSGRGEEADLEQGYAAGASAYFVKPVDLDDLVEGLRKVLREAT